MMSNFKNELEQEVEFINDLILRYLPDETGLDKKIREAMNYSVNAGGKRVRPMLMLEVYKLCGGDDCQVVYPFMVALECIHSYSLVHDDLPAMDNDDYRRGRLTTHKVFGEDFGILAGDGLLNLDTLVFGFRRIQLNLIICRIKFGKQLSFAHISTVIHIHTLDSSAHPECQAYVLSRFHPSGKLQGSLFVSRKYGINLHCRLIFYILHTLIA